MTLISRTVRGAGLGLFTVMFMVLAVNSAIGSADIVIDDVYVESSNWVPSESIASGQQFYIVANMSNEGNASTGVFNVSVYVDGIYFDLVNASSMEAGGNTSVWMYGMNRTSLGNLTLTVFADCLGEVSESNNATGSESAENNNWYNYTIGIHRAEWTVLAYLDGDNNLEGYLTWDLIDMAYAGSTSNVTIAAQLDRIDGYYTALDDWKDTRRYFVSKYNWPYEDNALYSIGEANMGSGTTFTNFLEWGTSTYLAEHYLVIPSNHGGSWVGLCWDDTSSHDRLTMSELESSLDSMTDDIGHKVDLVLFDDCLMGSIEVFSQIEQQVDYVVASETVAWTSSFPYHRSTGYGIMDYLIAYPGISPKDFAIEIVNLSVAVNSASYPTQSVGAFDLSHAPGVIEDIDDMAEVLKDNMYRYRSQILSAREDADYIGGPYGSDTEEIVDLYQLMNITASKVDNETIDQLAQDIIDGLGPGYSNKLVMEEKRTEAADFCEGTSIYYPESVGDYKTYYPSSTNFTDWTYWDEFLAYVYDSTAPSNPSSYDSNIGTGSWTSSNALNISWESITDAGSGLYGYMYEWSSSATTPTSYDQFYFDNWTTVVLEDGVHYLNLRALDKAGNLASEVFTIGPFKIDCTNPETSDDFSGRWKNGEVSISLSPSDGCELDYTVYRIDGGSWSSGTTITIPAPEDHSNDGNHTVEYYSIDCANNTEEPTILVVSIDTDDPVITFKFDGASRKVVIIIEDALDPSPTIIIEPTVKITHYIIEDHAGNTVQFKLKTKKLIQGKWRTNRYVITGMKYGDDPWDNTKIKFIVKKVVRSRVVRKVIQNIIAPGWKTTSVYWKKWGYTTTTAVPGGSFQRSGIRTAKLRIRSSGVDWYL